MHKTHTSIFLWCLCRLISPHVLPTIWSVICHLLIFEEREVSCYAKGNVIKECIVEIIILFWNKLQKQTLQQV